MGGARGVSRTEWERRKKQQNGAPIPADLGALERRFKAKQEKTNLSDVLTSEQKRVRINKLRTDFRQEWIQTRQRILEQLDAEAETARRTANPPPTDAMLQRMGLLASVHVPAWSRTAGNIVRDAERFAQEGDVAGLRLARQHAGVLQNQGARSALLEGIDKALDEHATDEQRAAATRVRSLEGDRERFALGSGMRERFIRESTKPIGPASTPRVPMAGTPQPQR